MNNLFKLILITILIFMVSGCTFIKNFNVDIPNVSNFTSQDDAFYYELNDSKDLNADINVCTTRFEILNYDENKIKVEVFYDELEVRNKINFSFNEDQLKITKSSQKSRNCSGIRLIDSYVRISLPKEMNQVKININAYSSFAIFDNLKYNELIFDQINGSVKVNGEINALDIEVINGIIEGKNLTTKSLNFKSTNGILTVNNLKNIQSISMKTVNGKIEMKDVNKEGLASVTLNASTTNGSLDLDNVYVKTASLKTVNGSITYKNENKDFKIEEVTYQKVNGSTTFDINGKVTKK